MSGTRKSHHGSGALNYAALFRGVNVGGKNILPMAELAVMFSKAGCTNVQTYIQSGNVVFTANPDRAAELPQAVSAKVAKRFGFSPVIVLRTAQELAAASKAYPFTPADIAAGFIHIGFLEKLPESQHVTALDPKRSPGDFFHINGREIYLKLAAGIGKTKLTNAWFDSKLATISTFRNWRTLLKLVEMTRDA